MKYQVIVLDLDGTLTNSKKEITPPTRDALIEIQQNGKKVVLASGRPINGVAPLAEELYLKEYGGFMLSFNGARITRCSDNAIIYNKVIPQEVIRPIYEAVKEYGAIFLMQIGDKLASGEPHDGRAPDYDDWSLNGDIIVYYPVLDIALELSSMGIRVDKKALLSQLKKAGCEDRKDLPFQKAIINEELPYTIGGGIGQSRICMFFLRKAHIGEVQSSLWPEDMIAQCEENGVQLL